MIDIAAALAERHPTATLVVTWVCDKCARGWTAPGDWRRPTCPTCGRPAEERGVHAAIPLEAHRG